MKKCSESHAIREIQIKIPVLPNTGEIGTHLKEQKQLVWEGLWGKEFLSEVDGNVDWFSLLENNVILHQNLQIELHMAQ